MTNNLKVGISLGHIKKWHLFFGGGGKMATQLTEPNYGSWQGKQRKDDLFLPSLELVQVPDWQVSSVPMDW